MAFHGWILKTYYRYGGVYLDCDIVVLKPISTFRNSVGSEKVALGSTLNGAVMVFSKHRYLNQLIYQILPTFGSIYQNTRENSGEPGHFGGCLATRKTLGHIFHPFEPNWFHI